MRRPVYNFKGLKPRLCHLHKEDTMINLKERNHCHHEGCPNPVTHKESGKKSCKKMCANHKEEGMIMVAVKPIRKTCAEESCDKMPAFNFKGEKPRFCTNHKETDMVNINKVMCVHEGCELTASFNLPGKTFGRFCSAHKAKDMINLKYTPCAKEGCGLKPYYNFRGQTRGKFCTQHREEGMVNLLIISANRVCERTGCEKCACFSFAKTDTVRYCGEHKQRGMFDVQNSICEHADCGKRPNFNFSGMKKGRFCTTHMEEGMTNVVKERRKEREGLVASTSIY
jgi:hypothetical protein